MSHLQPFTLPGTDPITHPSWSELYAESRETYATSKSCREVSTLVNKAIKVLDNWSKSVHVPLNHTDYPGDPRRFWSKHTDQKDLETEGICLASHTDRVKLYRHVKISRKIIAGMRTYLYERHHLVPGYPGFHDFTEKAYDGILTVERTVVEWQSRDPIKEDAHLMTGVCLDFKQVSDSLRTLESDEFQGPLDELCDYFDVASVNEPVTFDAWLPRGRKKQTRALK